MVIDDSFIYNLIAFCYSSAENKSIAKNCLKTLFFEDELFILGTLIEVFGIIETTGTVGSIGICIVVKPVFASTIAVELKEANLSENRKLIPGVGAGLSKGKVLVPTGGTKRGTNNFRFIIKHEGREFDFFQGKFLEKFVFRKSFISMRNVEKSHF